MRLFSDFIFCRLATRLRRRQSTSPRNSKWRAWMRGCVRVCCVLSLAPSSSTLAVALCTRSSMRDVPLQAPRACTSPRQGLNTHPPRPSTTPQTDRHGLLTTEPRYTLAPAHLYYEGAIRRTRTQGRSHHACAEQEGPDTHTHSVGVAVQLSVRADDDARHL
jgi:hypothetical protein